MNFNELVDNTLSVMRSNDVPCNRNFNRTYFLQNGLGAKARILAERCVNIMWDIVKDGVNGGFSKKGKTLVELSDIAVSLTKIDDGKVKKLEQIKKRLEEIDMSKQTSNNALDLHPLVDYIKDTKQALQNVTNPDFSINGDIPAIVLSKSPAVLEKLDELTQALQDGKICDLSSKNAAKLEKEIFDMVYCVRSNILNRNITSETLLYLNDAIDKVNSWKLLVAGVKNRELAKGDDLIVHSNTVVDRSIKNLADGALTLEKFTTFEALLNDKGARTENLQKSIDDLYVEISKIDERLAENEAQKKAAVRQYKNDGNKAKLDMAAEKLFSEKDKLDNMKQRMQNRRDNLLEKMDADTQTEYMIRENIYDPVMQFSDSFALFIEAAADIPYDVINGMFQGLSTGQDSLEEFKKIVMTLGARHDQYVNAMEDARFEADKVLQALKTAKGIKQAENKQRVERHNRLTNNQPQTQTSKSKGDLLLAEYDLDESEEETVAKNVEDLEDDTIFLKHDDK